MTDESLILRTYRNIKKISSDSPKYIKWITVDYYGDCWGHFKEPVQVNDKYWQTDRPYQRVYIRRFQDGYYGNIWQKCKWEVRHD